MSDYVHSVVVICAAGNRGAIKQVVAELGQTTNLTVPLSASGNAPATHFGMHTWARAPYKQAVLKETVVASQKFTQKQISDELAKVTVSVDRDGLTRRAHFDTAIARLGLVRIVEPGKAITG